MKKWIYIFALLATFSTTAQNVADSNTDAVTAAVRTMTVQKTEWLSPFTKVEVDGSINITFKRVESDEGLKIIYDTKGNPASRFRAGVDKNGVLEIVDRAESKQAVVSTDVTIWYKSLDNIVINRATATFEDVVESKLIDVYIKGGAIVTMDIKALDALVECTGRSCLKIGGESRYFKLDVSTAKVDGSALQTTSANIDASHEAEVTIAVSERLEAVTSTSAKLYYKGEPTILRNKNSLFGGEIMKIE